MAGEAVFRSEPKEEAKVEVVEEKPVPHDVNVGVDSKTEVPVALYKTLEGKPYTAEFFGVSKIWDSPDIGMKKEVEAIEDYYVKQVQRKEIADSKKSFEKYIKTMEKAVGVSDLTPRETRISKLAEYVRFMLRVERIDKEKW